jgi:hypothetical protein
MKFKLLLLGVVAIALFALANQGRPEPAIRGTTIGPAGAGAGSQSGGQGPGLKRALPAAVELPASRAFDLSHVKPEYFAEALGNDPGRIFSYVRDHIAFEPYVGVLRGPRGTLLAMAGNSVDRATLLASLLTAAGQQVRYVRGALPEAIAAQLVGSVWAERPWLSSRDPRALAPEVQALARGLETNAGRDGLALKTHLVKAGQPTPAFSAITQADLIREARDHYWVQWLRDERWTDLDPLLDGATPGQTFTKAENVWDSLPEELFHRVEFRVRALELGDAGPVSREILQFDAKSADLSAVEITLTHALDKSPAGNQVRPELRVSGELTVGSPFWITAPRTNASVTALDALSGGGGNVEALAIAESLDLTFIDARGRSETVTRELFDRVGPARRLSKAPNVDVLTTDTFKAEDLVEGVHHILITTGAVDESHLRDVVAPPGEGEEGLEGIVAGLARLTITFAAASDAILVRSTNGILTLRTYLDTPRALIAELSLKGVTSRISLDLRRNRKRILMSGLRAEHQFYGQVLQGVVDGTLERIVMDGLVGPGDAEGPAQAVLGTSLLFEQAERAGVTPVLHLRDSSAFASDISPDARARMQEALRTGRLIVAPPQPVTVEGTRRMAWWQVDPVSGETIAVTDDGLHQALIEATVTRNKDGTATIAFRVGGRTIRHRIKNINLAINILQGLQNFFGNQVFFWKMAF